VCPTEGSSGNKIREDEMDGNVAIVGEKRCVLCFGGETRRIETTWRILALMGEQY